MAGGPTSCSLPALFSHSVRVFFFAPAFTDLCLPECTSWPLFLSPSSSLLLLPPELVLTVSPLPLHPSSVSHGFLCAPHLPKWPCASPLAGDSPSPSLIHVSLL